MPKIKVALVGVGNCASALVQGTCFYRNMQNPEEAVGLRNLVLGGYQLKDIEFVCAFDIQAAKVGRDLSEAIFSPPNNTLKIADPPYLYAPVFMGHVLDGIGEYVKSSIEVSALPPVDVAQKLRETGAEIVVNLLPSGAVQASHYYAEQSLKAGCAFINCTPVFIASDTKWDESFRASKLPLVGDDLEDQVGATTLHKALLRLLSERGVRIVETYQLDVGGGAESLDTLERTKETKRLVKTKSVEATLPYKASVVAGSTDYVDFLNNRRDSFFWIKGLYFGKVPMELDLRLTTVDAPNAGSVLLDVIRATKIALDRKIGGSVTSISNYAFKHPLKILPPETIIEQFYAFIQGKIEG
ncbi:MAG: inositol-3-phosphate synthase [Candidatus Bathyarchaeia archaeon]